MITYNANSNIKLKTKMLKSSLSDYGHADILVEGIVTITGAERADAEVVART